MDEPNFKEDEVGHSTVGPHRAWCHTDNTWCDPNLECDCCMERQGFTKTWVRTEVKGVIEINPNYEGTPRFIAEGILFNNISFDLTLADDKERFQIIGCRLDNTTFKEKEE